MRLILSALLAATTAAAGAQGLAGRDLSTLGDAAVAALGPGYQVKAEPQRMTLLCADCAGTAMVDVLIGRQDDGTEGRVRAGTTRIADLERVCRAREPRCAITALDVAPAVGWISSYPMGGTAGATAVILRDGDLLTIRSIAADAGQARAQVDKLLPLARSRIIGR